MVWGSLTWAASALNYDHLGVTVVQPLMHPNMAKVALFYVCIFYYLESMDCPHTQMVKSQSGCKTTSELVMPISQNFSTSYAASYIVFGTHFQKERAQGKCSLLGVSSFKKGGTQVQNSCFVCVGDRHSRNSARDSWKLHTCVQFLVECKSMLSWMFLQA